MLSIGRCEKKSELNFLNLKRKHLSLEQSLLTKYSLNLLYLKALCDFSKDMLDPFAQSSEQLCLLKTALSYFNTNLLDIFIL